MTDQEVAADHLKIIRSLMERATVYRAISAPAALFGGIVALCVGLFMILKGEEIDPSHFFLIWVSVLAVAGLFNTILLWKKSKSAGEPLVSSGMKLAMRATFPPMLAGGVTSYFVGVEYFESCVLATLIWVVFYSLALLAASSFAPRSMRWLGWMFFAAGMILFPLLRYFHEQLPETFSDDQAMAGLVMALTFGLLHIVYALIILVRKPQGEEGI